VIQAVHAMPFPVQLMKETAAFPLMQTGEIQWPEENAYSGVHKT
jgi:hypothetical protein